MAEPRTLPHMAHWGAFRVTVANDEIVSIDGHPDDPAPSPLNANLRGGLRRGRVARPAIRRGWLDDGPGPDDRRGRDRYVEVSWDEALDLVSAELRRVRDTHGNESIFGGSYGWASAGRFHHAQSQLHRFLNCIGGYTSSVNSYSLAGSEVLLPHITGYTDVRYRATTWADILEHTDLVVAFGGMNPKNAWVVPGGVTRHTLVPSLAEAGRRGLRFELISPLRDDLPAEVASTWHAVRPGTDTAVMLGLAHVVLTENLADTDFLDRYTLGWDRLASYVTGEADGTPKTPEWAWSISAVSAGTIRDLAHRMAQGRTLVTVSWSMQRAEHGEQPVWMGVALASLLGQIGLPGGGFGHGYGSMGDVGLPEVVGPLPTFPQGRNPVRTYIPVARIADLLNRSAETLEFNGDVLELPDTRLVYWAGGNPFHHHQDLFGLERAFARPDTVIVNEPFWTATARHADIVLPVTTSLERDDVGAGRNDGYVIAMPRALDPYESSRDDYAILGGLADRLGVGDAFTEGRGAFDWIEHMYARFRRRAASAGIDVPEFGKFWLDGEARLAASPDHHTMFEDFRADPTAHPLSTPSGRIEVTSATIESFGYDDCPAHPTWIEPVERLGGPAAARFPLGLVANQPSTRLHGQLDGGGHSRAGKVGGREPIRIHPADAAVRGISDGDTVKVFNDRGACLAGAVLSEDVRPSVVQLSTGAWFEPVVVDGERICVAGNPNVLTADRGTSRLAQGSIGQLALVDVARFDGEAPLPQGHVPPID